MAVTVSMDATWRLNRVEFYAPHAPHGSVTGHGEVLLQEPAEPVPGTLVGFPGFPGRPVTPPHPGETGPTSYGVLPAAPVTRNLASVMEETVEVDDQTVTFAFAMDTMRAFIEKWRIEDEANPPVAPGAVMVPPVAPEPTPMAAPKMPPLYTDSVPPPNTGDLPPPPPPQEGEERRPPPPPLRGLEA